MANNQLQAYHNLYLMLEAGVPILRSLEMAGKATRGRLRRAWQDVRQAVLEGEGLAEAMRKHPKEFAPLDVAIVEAGEVSGDLPGSLKRLERWYNFFASLKKTVTAEMALPVLVLIVAALVIPFPNWFLGKISDLGYLLRVLMPLAALFVPVAAIWCIVHGTNKGGPLRIIVDWTALKIPVLGRAIKQLAISRYLRAFHTLFKAGVPVIRCAQMSAQLTGNAIVSGWVKQAAETARVGYPLSEGFTREFPKEYLEAWQVGEESGKLAEVTERLAGQAEAKSLWMMEQIGKWTPKVIYAIICLWMISNIFKMATGAYSDVVRVIR
ncbi:MAG: hypothetical protein GWP14_01670 [Actinobacteria bacterium]|nr:hypothetical protein [Actinomycetota bacterium]